jgi:starch-binding outer membrane protein, SusD/RagB family
MKKTQFKLYSIVSLLLIMMFFTSCVDDLDQAPENDSSLLSDEELFKNPASYKQFLAKLYAGLATTGQKGPAGSADISFIDEGFSQYIRGYWNMQELTTDEAIIAWNDATIKDFHWHTWTPLDGFINATFSRLAFQVTNCNEFLRQTTDDKLNSRGVDQSLRDEIKVYRAEARFLRALSYWHIVDLFGGAAIETELSSVDYHVPAYASRAQIFEFVESELTSLEGDLKNPNSNEQFRVDKAASWMLKAKLLMNAEIYVGANRYADAKVQLDKIITQSTYEIHDNYKELFLADNGSNGAQKEFIFAVAYDGIRTKTFGGTTYLTHAPVGGTMNAANFGINGGWQGLRTTSTFVNLFAGMGSDSRGNFYSSGQSLEIANVGSFTDGYAVQKWRNVDVNGNQGSDSSGDFVDIDFPIFRLADVYLMSVECDIRLNTTPSAISIGYINELRQRAHGNASGNVATIGSGNAALNFILDERGRELHWEGHRRTDLIRFGRFTGGTSWPWRGKVAAGISTPIYRNLFPIPSNAISSNPNLIQNPGY